LVGRRRSGRSAECGNATVGIVCATPGPGAAAPGPVTGPGPLDGGGGLLWCVPAKGGSRGAAAHPSWSGAQRSVPPRTGLPGALGAVHNAPGSADVSDRVQISHYGGASPAAADETGRYSKTLVVNNRPISLQHRGRAYVATIQAVRDEWRVVHAGRESQPARARPRRSPSTRPPFPSHRTRPPTTRGERPSAAAHARPAMLSVPIPSQR